MALSASGITFNEQPKLLTGLTPTNLTDIVHKQYADGIVFKDGDKTKNIEIGRNHVIPDIGYNDTNENTNIYIGGEYNGTNSDKDKGNIVIGIGSLVSNEGSVSIGFNTKITAQYGVVVGAKASADGAGVAIGYNTRAVGNRSIFHSLIELIVWFCLHL
jgi:hypothetical protein